MRVLGNGILEMANLYKKVREALAMKKILAVAVLLAATSAHAVERRLTFTWDPNPATDNVTSYSLERNKDGGAWSTVNALILPAPALELSDTIVGGTGDYNYRLRATNQWGTSEPSNVVDVNTAVPGAPGKLNIKVTVEIQQN